MCVGLAQDDLVGRDVQTEMDRELIREIAAGSAEALGHLYDKHAARVFGLARRILARTEDAEEVVQDVFAQVWREARRYRPERASVAGWMVVLARTRAIDRLRARRARPDLERGVQPSPTVAQPTSAANPEQVSISSDDARQVKAALEKLPENQRAVIELAYYEGLSHTEIVTRTGVPLGTVKTRIRAAMETLRGVLAS
jgi:RNA polymerase sigma-70 factor (ECF subfamily)